ncbi:HAD family hydrolase [Nanoarchaeota archaeon]
MSERRLYNRATGERIEFAGFDGDRTLVTYDGSEFGSSWDFVGHTYYPIDEWQGIARRFHKKISVAQTQEEKDKLFMEWVDTDIAALKGKDVHRVYEQTVPYTKGAEEYLRNIRANNAAVYLAIISAGLGVVFDRIADELDFDSCLTNRPGVDETGMFDGTIDIQVTLHDKKASLESLLSWIGGVELRNVMFVGDDYNDVECLQAVKEAGGLALAVNPLPEVEDMVSRAANAVIQDFTELEQYTEIR